MAKAQKVEKNQGGTLRQLLDSLPEEQGSVEQPTRAIMGRPSKYSKELADEICARIGDGESLRKITRDDSMPEGRTVWRWLREKDDFRQHYALAKEEAADALSEDIQDIADKTLAGMYDPQASRVAIDAYKWTASKLKAKKYGDRIDHTSDGKALPQPILTMLVNGPTPTSDTKSDVIDGETVDQVSENTRVIPTGNIMDDING